jgi:hypothetical protein
MALTALTSMAASPAHAALSINLNGPNATFGNSSVFCSIERPCNFTDTITFTTDAPFRLVSASIVTIAVGGAGSTSDINFTSVTLDGVALSLYGLMGGVFEVGGLIGSESFAPNSTHTLTVSGVSYGTSAGLDGSYSGTLVFASNATLQTAIPEPATWVSWMLGLAAICQAMRRRHRCHVPY